MGYTEYGKWRRTDVIPQLSLLWLSCPDRKVHGVNMGSIWGRQDLGGPHDGPMDFAIWVVTILTAILHTLCLPLHRNPNG